MWGKKKREISLPTLKHKNLKAAMLTIVSFQALSTHALWCVFPIPPWFDFHSLCC